MTERGWLLLERGGALWALPCAAVSHIHKLRNGSSIELRGRGEIAADSLLEVAPELACRPVPECVATFTPRSLARLATWRQRPVAVLDPQCGIPAELLVDGSEETDAEER